MTFAKVVVLDFGLEWQERVRGSCSPLGTEPVAAAAAAAVAVTVAAAEVAPGCFKDLLLSTRQAPLGCFPSWTHTHSHTPRSKAKNSNWSS